jgi:predicted RNA-binding Zn-ribbon protein involved in translation (DUF1610 family)
LLRRETDAAQQRRAVGVTTIKASCPGCGEVELTSNDITLRVASHAPLSYYQFTCPGCTEAIRKPADDHIISLLMSGGVRAEVWEVPAEALEPKGGPELTYDDLLDFVIGLNRDDMLAARATTAAHR